jgi:uncharacterized protein (DUF2141 family)
MKFIITLFSWLFFLNTPNHIQRQETLNPEKARLVDVELIIKKIRTNKGKIRIGIFKDNASFDKEIPFKAVLSSKQTLSNGVLKVNTQLEPGVYGASLVDDENDNDKMDYNFVGIPKEGFGFSNYYHTGFTKPKIQAFQFEVKEGVSPKIEMVIRYL